MLLKNRMTTILGLGLLALQVCLAQGQQQAQPSSTSSVSGSTATPTSAASSTIVPESTTVISTITTTLSSGQSLPSSLRSVASESGNVYFIPVITAIAVATNATSTAAPSSTSSSAASATSTALIRSSNSSLPLDTVIDPAFGVLGAILIVAGLPMAFYGHRNRWSSYFLSGFFAMALITISIILKVGVEPAVNPPSKAIRGLFLVAAMIAGAVGGIISIVFWRGAGLFSSGLGGFFFGLFLQAVRPGGLIRPVGLRFILYIGLFAVFFTVSCIERVHSLTLALATAIMGATALTLGIDCYSTQGLKEFYVRNLGFDALFSSKYPPTFENSQFPLVQGMQIELGVLGALILMGFAFQMRLWSDLRNQLEVLRRSDDRRNLRNKAERAARAVARSAKRDLEEWEAKHGYNKTSGRNAIKDEESGFASGTPDAKDARSRTSSFMTLMRHNTDATQLATPTSYNEKLAESPATSGILDTGAYPFPAQTGGRRSSNFLEYIQKGPTTERVEPVEPMLRLDLPSNPTSLGDFRASPVTTPAPGAVSMSLSASGSKGTAFGSHNSHVSHQAQSLDLTRATSPMFAVSSDSFRQRSASTAALMENTTSFLDPTPPKTGETKVASNSSSAGTEGGRSGNASARTQSQPIAPASATLTSPSNWNQPLDTPSHERTFSNPATPTTSALVGSMPMAKSSSYQGNFQQNFEPLYRDPYAQSRQIEVQQGPLSSPSAGNLNTISGGQSSAVTQARRALAARREDQPAVPWTNPGADAAQAVPRRGSSAEVQSPKRSMTIEELEARHRAKLAALQAPATQTVQEADALRKAKEEWERKQKLERRRMYEREMQKQAAAAASGSASSSRVASPAQGSTSSREERRRSRALSATLLEAVGEEARETGGVNKAAEWRRSISTLEQLDPRAKPSNPSTPNGTRPTSPQPRVAAERVFANPFPSQPQDKKKRLSETDRRRLSQGAGDRSQRRQSQALVDFDLPNRDQ